MRAMKGAAAGLGVLLACLLAAPVSRANRWNEATKFTFSGPVEIPGRVLPAGTYLFQLLDSPSDRFIVQIFNGDRTHLYQTVMAIPDYRLQPTAKTVLTFEERAANSPPAIRAWFYPGDLYGSEFVYPHHRAVELASLNKVSVPAMPESAVKSSPKELAKTPITAITPEKQEVEVSKAIQTTPHPLVAENKTLPKTASLTPLIALLGSLSLALGLGCGFILKRYDGASSTA
ncbi:MAG TPA: hypothetical protein VMU43_12560 [Candidatus Acidoferrum sp.]|nr:hypothetical protein [Candidatus Acidoferrum sp.]